MRTKLTQLLCLLILSFCVVHARKKIEKTCPVGPVSQDKVNIYNDIGEQALNSRDFLTALACFNELVKLFPNNPVGYSNMAVVYKAMGDLEGELWCYEEVERRNIKDAEMYALWGKTLSEKKGKHQKGIEKLKKAIKIDPQRFESYNTLSQIYRLKGDFENAINTLKDLVTKKEKENEQNLNKSFWNIYFNLATLLKHEGEIDDSLQYYEKAIEIDSERSIAPYNLVAVSLINLEQRLNHAEKYLGKCLQFIQNSKQPKQPNSPTTFPLIGGEDITEGSIYYHLGLISSKQHNNEKAVEYYKKSLEVSGSEEPTYKLALSQLGNGYLFLNEFQSSLKIFEELFEKVYEFPNLNNYPNFDPQNFSMLILNEGSPHPNTIFPEYISSSFCNFVRLKHKTASWKNWERYIANLKNLLSYQLSFSNVKLSINPWGLLSLPNVPTYLHDLVATRVMLDYERPIDLVPLYKNYKTFEQEDTSKYGLNLNGNKRIKLGYLGGGLKKHPNGQTLFRLFQYHDKSKFETFVYVTTPPDDSYWSFFIQKHADHFLDISLLSDLEAAKRVAQDKIDILLNLDLHTDGSRNQIFAYEPSPVQISCFGSYGILGASWTPHQLADKYSVVETEYNRPGLYDFSKQTQTQNLQVDYYVPHIFYPTYLFIDNVHFFFGTPAEEVSKTPQMNVDYSYLEPSLPTDKFIFCNFGKYYKITPIMFESWIAILHKVPDSILWLLYYPLESPDLSLANLLASAAQSGISHERIIITKLAPLESQFLVKSSCHLYLDTNPYGSHTTLAEAVYAGVPSVTLISDSMVTRTGASILRNSGLGELIVDSYSKYVELAVQLAQKCEDCDNEELDIEKIQSTELSGGVKRYQGSKRLRELTKKVISNRDNKSAPFFDNMKWVKDFEKALQSVWNAEKYDAEYI